MPILKVMPSHTCGKKVILLVRGYIIIKGILKSDISIAGIERFTRIKHTAGFPIKAIKFCLDMAQISIDQVDHITINKNPNQKLLKKILFASTKLFNLNFIKNRFYNFKKINSIKDEFESHFKIKINSKIHNIDHHTAHIASSVFFSGMKNSNFISVDGFGDFVSIVTGYFGFRQLCFV
jgi:carbamoyltransferase